MSKVLADMHVPPAIRRWSIRLVLALIVAGAIAWIPQGGDARADRLRRQLDDLRTEAAALRAGNADLAGEVDALRTDRRAIEDHARDELGMVYPGEMVLKLEAAEASP
ncbi:MAG TPA: septum formation initiator family protein [Kofleriaceae bacterium]|nr:septum formation initiator family protein [Kofleriaceae bacterium]